MALFSEGNIKRGLVFWLLGVPAAAWVGILLFFLPMFWAFGGSPPTDATAGVMLIIGFIVGLILIVLHIGRVFLKGYIIGAIITLVPFGLLLIALPGVTSNDPIGLILLIIGLVFSIYQGIKTACDADEHALLGRLWRDGFSAGIPGLIADKISSHKIYKEKDINIEDEIIKREGEKADEGRDEEEHGWE